MDRDTAFFAIGFAAGAAFMLALALAVSVAREFVDDMRFAVEFDRIARDMEREQES